MVFTTEDGVSWTQTKDGLGKEITPTAATSVLGTAFTVVTGTCNNGTQGLALHTTDNGKSWTASPLPAKANGVAAFTPSQWVFCSDDIVYLTRDAGQTWSKWLTGPPNTSWDDVAINNDIVMATGWNPNESAPLFAAYLLDWAMSYPGFTGQRYFKVFPGSI